MGNWTPGPWRIYTPDDYEGPDSLPGLGIESESGEAVVWYAELPDQGIANDRDASLIAAAPCLLAALESLLGACGLSAASGKPFAIDSPGIIAARAAIAKATGE